ncbi:MAG TPA: PDZ domain-containing protein, partial [Rudaea sp.]
LQLGDQRIEGVAGDLYTGDKGSFANPDIGGNLGGGVLRRFTVTFDYANRTMYLAPNANFGKADDFDRSGLWLILDGDALRVIDTAPQSAGARADLRADDRIVAISGEAIKARSLPAWRERLRTLPAGTRLKVAFERGGTKHETELVLADRIAAQAQLAR